MLQVAIGAALVLLVALVAAVIWLSRSRTAETKAKVQTNILKKQQETRSEADKVMAEPVADEDAWLAAARQRLASKLRDARRQ